MKALVLLWLVLAVSATKPALQPKVIAPSHGGASSLQPKGSAPPKLSATLLQAKGTVAQSKGSAHKTIMQTKLSSSAKTVSTSKLHHVAKHSSLMAVKLPLTNFVSNGDFEFGAQRGAGSWTPLGGDLGGGWIVVGENNPNVVADIINQDRDPGFYAVSGQQAAHLRAGCWMPGSGVGGLQQTIVVTPGYSYQLSFAASAGNWNGALPQNGKVTLVDTASPAATLVSSNFACTGFIQNNKWDRFSFTFTATTAKLQLSFMALDKQCINIDDVKIVVDNYLLGADFETPLANPTSVWQLGTTLGPSSWTVIGAPNTGGMLFNSRVNTKDIPLKPIGTPQYAHLHGNCFMAATGTGGIQQTVTLEAGRVYTLTFHTSGGNWAGSLPLPQAGFVTVTDATGMQVLKQIFYATGYMQNSKWDVITMSFLASTSTLVISFQADGQQCISVDDMTLRSDNYVLNGDFEWSNMAVANKDFPVGGTELPYWNVVSQDNPNSVSTLLNSQKDATLAAQNGFISSHLHGSCADAAQGQGGIQQMVAVSQGVKHTLTFWATGGAFASKSTTKGFKGTVVVTEAGAADPLLNESFVTTGLLQDKAWTTFTYTFTPNTPQVVLSFLAPASQCVTVDNVKLFPST